MGIIEFDKGPIFTHHITTAAKPQNLEANLTLVSEAGVVEIGGIAANEVLRWTSSESAVDGLFEEVEGVYGKGHFKLYEHIFENWDSLPTEITSPASASVSVETVERLYESARHSGDFDRDLEGFLQFGATEEP